MMNKIFERKKKDKKIDKNREKQKIVNRLTACCSIPQQINLKIHDSSTPGNAVTQFCQSGFFFGLAIHIRDNKMFFYASKTVSLVVRVSLCGQTYGQRISHQIRKKYIFILKAKVWLVFN